jgi:hypothetical protein
VQLTRRAAAVAAGGGLWRQRRVPGLRPALRGTVAARSFWSLVVEAPAVG